MDVKDDDFYKYFHDSYSELTRSGKAPWMKEGVPDREIAYNPINGVVFKGVNSVLLEMECARKGFKDNRWIPMSDAYELGLKPRYGEKPTPIAYINRFVHPTDVNPSNGMNFADGKKRIYYMYNMEQFKEHELTKSKEQTFSYAKVVEKIQNVTRNTKSTDIFDSFKALSEVSATQPTELKKLAVTMTQYRLAQETQTQFMPPVPTKELQTELLKTKRVDDVIKGMYFAEVIKDKAVAKDNALEHGKIRTVERDRGYQKEQSLSR